MAAKVAISDIWVIFSAILNHYVAKMPPNKFQVNLTYGSGEDVSLIVYEIHCWLGRCNRPVPPSEEIYLLFFCTLLNTFNSFLASSHFCHLLITFTNSADNLCKQVWPRSGPAKCLSSTGSKPFDTLIVFLKEFFEKVNFEKSQQATAKTIKVQPSMQKFE